MVPSSSILYSYFCLGDSSSFQLLGDQRNDKPFPSFTLNIINPKHHKKQQSPCRTSALVFLCQCFFVNTHQKYVLKAFKYIYKFMVGPQNIRHRYSNSSNSLLLIFREDEHGLDLFLSSSLRNGFHKGQI